MRVIVSRSYFGPNRYTCAPAAFLLVDLEPWAKATNKVREPTFWQRFDRVLPGSREMSPAAAQELLLTAQESAAEAVIQTAIRRILHSLDHTLSSLDPVQVDAPDRLGVLLGCGDPEVGRRAGVLAVRLIGSLLGSGPENPQSSTDAFDFAADLQALVRFAESRRATDSQAAILAVAEERGIPAIRFDRWPLVHEDTGVPSQFKGLLQLGQGIFQKRILGTATADVSPLVLQRLSDHRATHEDLSRAGIPVPARDRESTNINSARRALRSARRLGYPLVLKPWNRNGGLGVALNLRSGEAVSAAYELAGCQQRRVVVERYIPGDTYRLLVIGGEVFAACKKPPSTTADGGAIQEVALERFSPQLKATVLAAVACFELEVAGIDLVTRDPGVSLAESGGAVIGVDPAPDLGLHLTGDEQIPITAARRFLAHLFPRGAKTRIPIVAVTGTNGKTTTSRMVERILREAGYRTGLACSDGVYVKGRQLAQGVLSGISGALGLFRNPDVEIAVLETSRGTVLRRGLAFGQCDVAACTNVVEEHLGEYGIESVGQMAAIKRLMVEKARQAVVLNGDDENCLAMIPHIHARDLWLVSHDPKRPDIREQHRRGHGIITVLSNDKRPTLTVIRGDQKIPIIAVDEIPATFEGKAAHNVDNAMFAVGLAMGLGLERRLIQLGLSEFTTSIEQAPARLNSYDRLPFRVILDFAHNAHGFQALSRFSRSIDCRGRRIIVVYSDRDSAGVMPIARILAENFDFFVCRASAGQSGDAVGSSAQTVRDCLVQAGVSEDRLAVIPNMQQAVEFALAMAQPGDLVVIKTQSMAPAIWNQLDDFRAKLEDEQSQ